MLSHGKFSFFISFGCWYALYNAYAIYYNGVKIYLNSKLFNYAC